MRARSGRGQFLVAMVACVFVAVAGVVVLFAAAGTQWWAFGWLLLVVGAVFAATNVFLLRRPH